MRAITAAAISAPINPPRTTNPGAIKLTSNNTIAETTNLTPNPIHCVKKGHLLP